MSETLDQIYEFGGFTLDLRKGTLSRGSVEAVLRPKPHALLIHLAQNMGRVVPKAELMDAVWPGVYVTEDSLTQSVREIRKALGDAQELIRTVSRRGYMLVGSAEPAVAAEPAGQPIVAVLRFRNESGEAADASLVDGFAEDIIQGLARFGSVTVLARNTSFRFSSYAETEWSATAARIGADYLVEGSVRRSGNSSIIAVNLIDAVKATEIWGERYEADDLELFDVQRDIGVKIVNRLVTRLDEASMRRSAVKPAASLAAWELVTRGGAILWNYRQADAHEARHLFEEAIARDPNYGLAYANLALARVVIGGFGRASQAELEEVRGLAERAITLAPEQSLGRRVMSIIRLYLRQHAGAEHELRVALDLNRFDADSVAQMGYLLTLRGRAVEAMDWIVRSIRLNPIHPNWYDYDRSLAHYLVAEYQEAAEALELSPVLPPWIRTRLAACYAMLGDDEKAAVNARRINESDPSFSPTEYAATGIAFEHAADREHLAEGVARALELAQLPR